MQLLILRRKSSEIMTSYRYARHICNARLCLDAKRFLLNSASFVNSIFYGRDLLEQTANQVPMENVAKKVQKELLDYRDIQDNKADLVNQEILDQKVTEERQAKRDHLG